MKQALIALTILLIAGVVAWFIFSMVASLENNTEAENLSGPVATVNGEEIPRSDFEALKLQVAFNQGLDISTLDEQTNNQLELQVVDLLISEELLRQASVESGITASDTEIEEEFSVIKGQFENEEAYQNALTIEGLTESTLLVQIGTDLAIQAYLDQVLGLSSIPATESEIEELYNQLSSTQEGVPPLEEAYDQIEQMIVQQKQQELITNHLLELSRNANIEILI